MSELPRLRCNLGGCWQLADLGGSTHAFLQVANWRVTISINVFPNIFLYSAPNSCHVGQNKQQRIARCQGSVWLFTSNPFILLLGGKSFPENT